MSAFLELEAESARRRAGFSESAVEVSLVTECKSVDVVWDSRLLVEEDIDSSGFALEMPLMAGIPWLEVSGLEFEAVPFVSFLL